jgi:hypothetical protein
MIAEFIRAFITAGVPVGLTSFLLAWWGLKNGYFGSVADVKGLEREVKRLGKSKSGKRKRPRDDEADDDESHRPALNPVHNKWLAFGGGFYGVVALLTYGVIELGEIRDFINNLGGLLHLFANLSLNLVIDFLVDSFLNFFTALAWPIYWMSEIRGAPVWIWFVAAYAGYWAGTRFALHRAAGLR